MNDKTAAERASEVTDFVTEIVSAAEWRMRHGTTAAMLSYPRAEIALLKTCKEQLEVLREWNDHERRRSAIEDGIAGIDALRATAKAIEDRVTVIVNFNIARQLRDCIKYLIEYEVRKEQDGLSRPRRRA